MGDVAELTKIDLRTLAIRWVEDLATDEGINASGKEDIFACVFGRDTSLTCLKILRAHAKEAVPELLPVVRRALLTLVSLQGKEVNIENGEEPGKFIHEFRHDWLLRMGQINEKWYVGPDGKLRNYDSLDSTPLALLAIYKYWQATGDQEFLDSCQQAVVAGLDWIMKYGDKDKDFLLEYEISKARRHDGLRVQSWTDSTESMLDPSGKFPKYPIAPVEVQGEAWCVLKIWEKYFEERNDPLAVMLHKFAGMQKKAFNEKFILKDGEYHFVAQALDGYKRQIRTITGNPLICLWASIDGADAECIIGDEYIDDLVKRIFESDMFDSKGGVRTMSTKALTFNGDSNSYHNGSFWPILNGLISEGLENFGYIAEAQRLRETSLRAVEHFATPVELYVVDGDGELQEFGNEIQRGCLVQAWSAAAVLDWASSVQVEAANISAASAEA